MDLFLHNKIPCGLLLFPEDRMDTFSVQQTNAHTGAISFKDVTVTNHMNYLRTGDLQRI